MTVEHVSTPWTSQVLAAARESVKIAADQHRATVASANRTLAYYLRSSLAHGMTISEICDAADLDARVVLELVDPAAA